MRLTSILSAAVLPALTLSAAIDGSTSALEERVAAVPAIVGGNDIPEGQFIVLASLQTQNQHFCGGVLINKNTLVTAAHCSQNYPPSDVHVRVGSLNKNSGGQYIGVKKFYVHPKYNSSTFDSDIAVWKLATNVVPNKKTGFAILPTQGQEPKAGTMITVGGWGATAETNGQSPIHAKQIIIPAVARSECENTIGKLKPITQNMFCAGYKAAGKNSCFGDSGGPALETKSRKLDGLVNFGLGCAREDYYAVYVRVGNFVNWINGLAAL